MNSGEQTKFGFDPVSATEFSLNQKKAEIESQAKALIMAQQKQKELEEKNSSKPTVTQNYNAQKTLPKYFIVNEDHWRQENTPHGYYTTTKRRVYQEEVVTILGKESNGLRVRGYQGNTYTIDYDKLPGYIRQAYGFPP